MVIFLFDVSAETVTPLPAENVSVSLVLPAVNEFVPSEIVPNELLSDDPCAVLVIVVPLIEIPLPAESVTEPVFP